MDPNLVVSGILALAIFLIFFGLDQVWSAGNSTLEARLDRYAMRAAAASTGSQGTMGGPKTNRFNSLLADKAGAQIATDLARADLKITPSEFFILTIIAMLVGALVGIVLFRGSLVFGAAGLVMGFFGPRWYVRYLQKKRLTAFDGQLSDTIILLSNSLRSGYSLLQSMETVSKELPAPISVEFARVTREISLGLTVQEALANLLRRIPSPDLDLMITAINVQHEVGGNLAEILDTIAYTIRERVRIVGEIRSITAQQQLSARLLSLLPVLLGVVLYMLNPGYISQLWGDICGWMMMITGGIMVIAGYFIIQKIVTIEV